ncbi:MAG: LamG domain-containing protein, partial [Bacteroidales bacterium]|nr:LamG domain-containing protein [Bacteroidales bacterium]
MCNAQYDISITGEDTLCIGQSSQYSAEVDQSSNQYLFRDTTGQSSGGNGYFALNAGYDWFDITNTFTYDLWVQPTRTINMYGESNVCAGGVSVPLANSNQNWALVPVGLAGGSMSVGLTIGTNGLMVGEHSGNILVSRLSYTVSITDWIHVAIVYRTDSIFLYLDGDLVRSRPTHCSINEKCITSGLTGYYYGPDFKGNFDEFRLWDVALTHQQIQEIKDKKIVNQVDGLRYYASFDDGRFVRTLGDLGDENMTVSLINDEEYIKKSSWELGKYTGPDIDNLTAFLTGDFDYLWSTGETTQDIIYTPIDTLNFLSVEVKNDHYSLFDTVEIIGMNCCQEIYYDTVVVYDTVTQSKQDLQYLLYESYYSEDFGQVNVYEISAYSEGTNVALNKSTFTNSCEGAGENCGG